MARPGIVYNEVADAATELLGKGKNPTIEQIRHILGSGSSTTITKYLKQWRENQYPTAKLALEENLPPQMVSLMKGLWERLQNEAQYQIETLESDYKQKILELTQQLEKYKKNNRKWQELHHTWVESKASLDHKMSEMTVHLKDSEEALQTVHKAHDSLVQKMKEKQNRVFELHALHKQAQNNFEQYRREVKEQRNNDFRQFDQQIKEFKDEINVSKNKCETLSKDNNNVTQELSILKNEYKNIQAAHHHAESHSKQLKAELMNLEKSNHMLQQKHQEKVSELEYIRQTLDLKISNEIEHKAEMKALKAQLHDSQKDLTILRDENKLLHQDKWRLTKTTQPEIES